MLVIPQIPNQAIDLEPNPTGMIFPDWLNSADKRLSILHAYKVVNGITTALRFKPQGKEIRVEEMTKVGEHWDPNGGVKSVYDFRLREIWKEGLFEVHPTIRPKNLKVMQIYALTGNVLKCEALIDGSTVLIEQKFVLDLLLRASIDPEALASINFNILISNGVLTVKHVITTYAYEDVRKTIEIVDPISNWALAAVGVGAFCELKE